jgi:glucose-1-phosphate cytidylyltransferase
MNHYAFYNYKEFILCLGYLGWQIKNYFLNFKSMSDDFTIQLDKPWDLEFKGNSHLDCNWKITLAETGENSQTGARIRKIRRYVEKDSNFMMTYGDGLSDVNIEKLIKFHMSHGKVGTVTGVRPAGRFGEINVGKDNQVLKFHEKPQTTTGRINGGFFIFNAKRIWDYLPDRDNLNFERESLKEMTKEGELKMYPHDSFWQPMDTFREYKLLNDLWEEGIRKGRIPWPGEKLR